MKTTLEGHQAQFFVNEPNKRAKQVRDVSPLSSRPSSITYFLLGISVTYLDETLFIWNLPLHLYWTNLCSRLYLLLFNLLSKVKIILVFFVQTPNLYYHILFWFLVICSLLVSPAHILISHAISYIAYQGHWSAAL